jgi:hypothetical protein
VKIDSFTESGPLLQVQAFAPQQKWRWRHRLDKAPSQVKGVAAQTTELQRSRKSGRKLITSFTKTDFGDDRSLGLALRGGLKELQLEVAVADEVSRLLVIPFAEQGDWFNYGRAEFLLSLILNCV